MAKRVRIRPKPKRVRVAEIEARLMELEVAEEGLIEAMTLDGFVVLRRVDADPAAVLGIVRKPAAAKAA